MSTRLRDAAPLLFVLLWSTGFIGARLGLPHAGPLAFLVARYLAVLVLMTAIALATRAPWPRGASAWARIGLSGMLVHGVYLGGVFTAISRGLPAGITALVVGTQPLLTAVVAGGLMGERVGARQWAGLVLGFAGVALVVAGRMGHGADWSSLWPALLALAGITAGTLWQKRACPAFDWRTGAVAQFLPTVVATAAVAALVEPWHLEWTGEFVFALAWLVLVLSVGAVTLMNLLIRSGSAVQMASLFYLVPPCTALVAWALFHETFPPAALAGIGLAAVGVRMARA